METVRISLKDTLDVKPDKRTGRKSPRNIER
jgi:hypothetical protein